MSERKRCTKCGKTKALSMFTTDRTRKTGLGSWCKACNLAGVQSAQARRRALIGDEAWRAEKRQYLASWRAQTVGRYMRDYNAARREAVEKLIDRHPDEFDRLFRQAKRHHGLTPKLRSTS